MNLEKQISQLDFSNSETTKKIEMIEKDCEELGKRSEKEVKSLNTKERE